MRGVATGRAAVSVVNALPLGVGAAVGIEWPARTIAVLEASRDRRDAPTVLPRRSATAVVRAAARTALERYGSGGPARVRLTVRSTIPVARGLKSSSAVTTSVALATARAGGVDPAPEEIARLAAEVGMATGVSATGAFDDALAGLVPGGVVTDNRRNVELRGLDIDPELAVALWIPGRRHPRSPKLRDRFRREHRLARRAVEAALAGDWTAAMLANTAVVEKVMGYRYDRLHALASRHGAVAAGVTGLGPAFAVLAPRRRVPAVLRGFPRDGARRSARLFLAPSEEVGELR